MVIIQISSINNANKTCKIKININILHIMNYWWYTDYTRQTKIKPEATYGSYVIAETEEVALALLKLRGRGEKITSAKCKVKNIYRIPNLCKLYRQRKLYTLLHTVCFLSEVFITSGVMKWQDFLQDTGLIHEVVHESEFAKDKDFQLRKHILSDLQKLDKLKVFFGY